VHERQRVLRGAAAVRRRDARRQRRRLRVGGGEAFTEKCVVEITADRVRCEEMVERSLAMATALAPVIGYESAAKIAREALATGQTIRETIQNKKLLAGDELDRLLDPWRMSEPGIPNGVKRG
jgi:aspartate ammonia-lyase